MKLKLTIVILLLIALVGCSESAPAPVANNPPSTSETASPDASAEGADAPASDEAPAATNASRSAIPERVDVQGFPAATITDTNSYYRLQTLFSEEEATCLEGNRRADDAVLQGATFMDACQDVTGQLWKLVPTDQQGYYHLQTRFLEDQNKCLEGNQIAPDAELDGAAFMNDCVGATGQNWKFVEAGDGTYRLQTQFLEDQNKCLEGNRLEARALLQGAAFQDDCKDVTGQVWKLVPVSEADAASAINREIVDVSASTGVIIEDTSIYYRLQSAGVDEEATCLEGNGIADGAVLDGAAFMDACKDVTGQMWHIIPTDRPDYYHLQPMSLQEQGKCFEGNLLAPDAVLGGAAFMNDCTNALEQNWKFVDAGDGTYRLQTEFLEAQNKCLEGNRLADESLLKGAAFMDTCQNTDSQLWTLVPADSSEQK